MPYEEIPMANLADLKLVHSGGAANENPGAADRDLGGAISTAGAKDIASQTSSAPTTVTGVTVNDAAGNAEGTGTLFYDNNADSLRWTPPGGSAGTAVVVATTGDYSIQGGGTAGGLIKVSVVAASLPSSNQTNELTITNVDNNIYDDVAKADAKAGDIEYRGFYIQNDHATDEMVDIAFWLEENTPGQDVVQIALAAEAKNVAMDTIADEDTAPTGIDFDAANPVDYATGLAIPDLAAGDFKGIWIKRTVPAGTNVAQENNTFKFGVRIYV
jgi:hypothetical protein